MYFGVRRGILLSNNTKIQKTEENGVKGVYLRILHRKVLDSLRPSQVLKKSAWKNSPRVSIFHIYGKKNKSRN